VFRVMLTGQRLGDVPKLQRSDGEAFCSMRLMISPISLRSTPSGLISTRSVRSRPTAYRTDPGSFGRQLDRLACFPKPVFLSRSCCCLSRTS